MKRYSQERTEAILQKMAPPQSMTVAEVARQVRWPDKKVLAPRRCTIGAKSREHEVLFCHPDPALQASGAVKINSG